LAAGELTALPKPLSLDFRAAGREVMTGEMKGEKKGRERNLKGLDPESVLNG